MKTQSAFGHAVPDTSWKSRCTWHVVQDAKAAAARHKVTTDADLIAFMHRRWHGAQPRPAFTDR